MKVDLSEAIRRLPVDWRGGVPEALARRYGRWEQFIEMIDRAAKEARRLTGAFDALPRRKLLELLRYEALPPVDPEAADPARYPTLIDLLLIDSLGPTTLETLVGHPPVREAVRIISERVEVTPDLSAASPISGKRIAFRGSLDRMTYTQRKEAVERLGGKVVALNDPGIDILVYPATGVTDRHRHRHLDAKHGHDPIGEDEFYRLTGVSPE